MHLDQTLALLAHTMKSGASFASSSPGARDLAGRRTRLDSTRLSTAARAVVLSEPADTSEFEAACRQLLALATAISPYQVSRFTGGETTGLFPLWRGDHGSRPLPASEPAPPPKVPVWFDSLCETVSLHRDAGRFGLLYRLLWRLQHESALHHDPLDPDRVQAEHMAAAVRRDMHKMKAFVRFHPLREAGAPGKAPASHDAAGPALHVAWFEPEHHIVDATASFFVERFANTEWVILTPTRCVRWNGHALSFGPGADPDQAPAADAGLQRWLDYCASIFRPTRRKLAGIRKEMPHQKGNNLPEAGHVPPLTVDVARCDGLLVATVPMRHFPRPEAIPASHAGCPDDPGPPAPLTRLKERTDRCRECPLGEFATRSVVGEGPLRARVMFVGEQPDDQEDLQGRPFVGPAAKVFHRALAEIGVPRNQVYVSNAVKHFKHELRGKRRIRKAPAQQEIDACRHWLEDEIALVQPQALVALGATAARSLMGRAVAVMRERGQWRIRPDGRRVFITVHPSSLLRMAPGHQAAAYARWVRELRQAIGPAIAR